MISDGAFEREALESFGFLISDYGFKITCFQAGAVQFATDIVIVNLKFDATRSCELTFEMGLTGLPDTRAVDLNEILQSVQFEGAKSHTTFQASSDERLAKVIPQIATLVSEHAASFLRGDVKAFEAAFVLRRV